MTRCTLEELAQKLGAELVGDPNQPVSGVSHPALANSSEDLALILDKGILPLLEQKPVQTALVPEEIDIPKIPNQLKVKRPKVALAKLLDIFDKPAYIPEGIHPTAVIDPTATIEPNVTIGPLCCIGPHSVIGQGSRLVGQVFVGAHVTVGEHCIFYPGVVIGDRVQIGKRVILQAHASIGSDGFSYVTAAVGSVETAKSSGQIKAQNSNIMRINSIGTVVLEDEVEIGANACVDRATLGETRIKRGTKIDNLVQIAHNVTIGENCLMAGQVGIAGSTTIGNGVVFGGHVGVADHVTITDGAIIMALAGVASDITTKNIYMGAPAIPRKEFLQKDMHVKRIKGLSDQIKALTQQVEALEAQLTPHKTEQPV